MVQISGFDSIKFLVRWCNICFHLFKSRSSWKWGLILYWSTPFVTSLLPTVTLDLHMNIRWVIVFSSQFELCLASVINFVLLFFCLQGNLKLSDIGLAEKRIYHAALNGNNSLPRVLHHKEDWFFPWPRTRMIQDFRFSWCFSHGSPNAQQQWAVIKHWSTDHTVQLSSCKFLICGKHGLWIANTVFYIICWPICYVKESVLDKRLWLSCSFLKY